VVTLPAPAVSPQHALAEADALMYEVKRRGKGTAAYRVLGAPAADATAAGTQRAARS
jgi:hypothetical protein